MPTASTDVFLWYGTPSWFKAGLFSITGHRQLGTPLSPTGPMGTGPVLPTGTVENQPVEDLDLVTKRR